MQKNQVTEILDAIESLRKELRKLRLEIRAAKRPRPRPMTITSPEWCYEYPPMTIDVSAKEWKAIEDGKKMCLMGRGYEIEVGRPKEEEIYSEQDYWIFNVDSRGSVEVVMTNSASDCPDTAYSGGIEDCKTTETES